MRKYDRATNLDYRVTLECGCAIRLRNDPIDPGQRFVCPSGAGHGYRLKWVSSVGPHGYPNVNPDAN